MRNYSKCVAIVVLFAVIAVGCSSPASEPKTGNEPAKAKLISIGTSGVSGTFYPIGGAMAQVLTNQLPGVSATAEATGGGVENLRLVENAEMFAAMVSVTTTAAAFEGREPFKKGEFTKVRAAFNMFPGYMYMVTTDPDIKQISDLVGKRVTLGDAGSASVTDALDVLGALGITVDDIKPVYLGKANAMNALRDGLADVAIEFAGGRPAFISDFMATRKLYFVPTSSEEIEQISETLPYFSGTIPASWFNTPADVPTVVTYVAMYVNEASSEEDVYQFVKTIFDNLEEVKKAHPAAASISLETATLSAGAPFHPGATKYFKEKGLVDE